MIRSLRGRMFAAIVVAIVLSVALTVAIGATLARRTAKHDLATGLSRRADLLSAREQQQPSHVLQSYDSGDVHVSIRRAHDFVRLVPSTSHPSDGKLPGGLLYSYRPLRDRGMLLTRRNALRPGDWRPFVESLLIAGLVGSAVAAAASLLLSRSIARPVRRVARASRALAEGGTPEPLPLEGAAELVSLSRSFNEMSAQLRAAREAERTFLLSVSHELKTPLTAIRGYAEGLAEGAVDLEEATEVIGREAGRLERLVRDLLELARMNRIEFAVRHDRVDLADAAREVVTRYEPQSRALGVRLELDIDRPAPAIADGGRVVQVASNLVENALRETSAGGTVTVRARPGVLVVEDSGPGLTPEEAERAFERFYLYERYKGRRPVGTGLGLSIVKELTQAMGGSVSVAGSVFTVRLPSGPERRGVDDLEARALDPAERV